MSGWITFQSAKLARVDQFSVGVDRCGYIVRMGEEEANQLTEIQRGSTPIGNSRRSAFVRFGVSKQNYGTAIKDQWFERQEGGVLHPVQLMEPPQARERRRFAHGY